MLDFLPANQNDIYILWIRFLKVIMIFIFKNMIYVF